MQNQNETFRNLVMAVEENNRINDAKWSDWQDAETIQSHYGFLEPLNRHVFEVFLNVLIRDNGENLETYLDTYDCLTYGQPFAR